MRFHHKNKSIIFLLLCVGFVFAIMSFSSHQQPKHNFQILPQDISNDSLHHIMHSFNEALGVKCGFCHARSSVDTARLDFASDAKQEKTFARHMMKMTMAINANYFNWNNSARPDTIQMVKCITCHHGNPEPEKSLEQAAD